MKKILSGIALLLAGLLITCLLLLFGSGYARYRNAVKDSPVTDRAGMYFSASDFVPYEELDEDFVHAVVAVEDKRYFYRNGVDYVAMARALINNLIYQNAREGGSTIPQQIGKNLYFAGERRGLVEKMAEVYLMMDLERNYSKEDLFALYVNMNYYGDGYWGIAEASEGYYGKNCSDLSVGEAAMLAGLPNAPALFQWSTGYEYALQRRDKVLRRMYEDGYITEEQMKEAQEEETYTSSFSFVKASVLE